MLMDFQSGELPVLIGTDVASRGLHVPDVQYVINYDLPQDAEDYVHRIGRTARAGAAGDAISLGCETYVMSLPDIEDYIGHKIPVANYDPDDLPEIVKPKPRKRKPQAAAAASRVAVTTGGRGGTTPRDAAAVAAAAQSQHVRDALRRPRNSESRAPAGVVSGRVTVTSISTPYSRALCSTGWLSSTNSVVSAIKSDVFLQRVPERLALFCVAVAVRAEHAVEIVAKAGHRVLQRQRIADASW